MGRVVCELLSTQFCGSSDMNQIDLISGAIYFIPLLISAKLDERWSGFGGMRDRIDLISPPRVHDANCLIGSIIFLIEEGALSVFPSMTGLMEFNPWLSKICSLLVASKSKKFTKEIAPSRFLTVSGIVNEK